MRADGMIGRYDPTLDLTLVVARSRVHDSARRVDEGRGGGVVVTTTITTLHHDTPHGTRDGRGASRRAASRYYSRYRRVSRAPSARTARPVAVTDEGDIDRSRVAMLDER